MLKGNKCSWMVICLSVLGLMPVQAQVATRVIVGTNQSAGITYTLPRNGVELTATARCTTVEAGVFAPYAEKYLGITDAPQEDDVVWSLTGVSFRPLTEADTTRIFHLALPEKVEFPDYFLTPQGSIWAIGREPVASAPELEVEPEVATAAKPEYHPVDVMTEELLKAGSRSKQAEIAARQIFRIRESRLNILTGEVDNLPADGESFHVVLDNLAAQEAAYLELFVGKTSVKDASQTYTYFPADTTDTCSVCFRFSRHFGFVDADDLSGEPYQLSYKVIDNKIEVPVRVDAKGKVLPQAQGIAYIVPGKAQVELLYQGNPMATLQLTMAQLGHVEYLPAAQLMDKKAPKSALFCPQTGALVKFDKQP